MSKLLEKGYTDADGAVQNARMVTALVNHVAAMKHVFQYDAAKIIDRTNKSKNLAVLESCHIKTTPHTVNTRTDTDNLHIAYSGVFKLVEDIQKTKRKHPTNTNSKYTAC